MLRQVKFLFGAVVAVSLATTNYIVPVITEQAIAVGETKTLATIGEPVLAFYNPPWTLPMFRRNEIMLELAQP